MNKSTVFLMVMVAVLSIALPAMAKDIPWYTNTNGNPYTDTDGDTWAVYQIADSGTTYQDWSNYTAMTWNSTDSRWDGYLLKYGHPVYKIDGGMKNLDAAGYQCCRRSALTFDPAVSGNYSWTGKLRYQDNNGSRTATICFGKFSSLDVWSLSHSVDMTENQELDLATVTELQNISVGDGERMAIVITPPSGSIAALYFDSDTDNQTGITPEPATMTLLLLGLPFALRRRR